MNTDERGYFDALTERVLASVFEVSNNLGAGFLEKVAIVSSVQLFPRHYTSQIDVANESITPE